MASVVVTQEKNSRCRFLREKVMVRVVWESEGVLLVEFFERCVTVSSKRCVEH